MNTRRMNRLEELGRVDAEKAFTKKGARNLRDEKKRIVRELKAKGGKVKGVKEDPMRDRMKQPLKKIPKDPNKERPKALRDLKADGGRAKMPMKKAKDTPPPQFTKKGLRPVKPSQKGLKKLPTKVRNKMGYMKKGGRVGMGKAMRGGGCVR